MCSVAAGSGLYLHTLSPLKGGRDGGAALCLCVIKLFTLRHTQTVCACAVAQRELPRIYIFTSVERSAGDVEIHSSNRVIAQKHHQADIWEVNSAAYVLFSCLSSFEGKTRANKLAAVECDQVFTCYTRMLCKPFIKHSQGFITICGHPNNVYR